MYNPTWRTELPLVSIRNTSEWVEKDTNEKLIGPKSLQKTQQVFGNINAPTKRGHK